MNIRDKALAGIICIILLFLILLSGVSSSVIMKNYEDIESAQVTDYTNLVVSNIRSELSFLSTIARSWGEWDDTYAFAKGENPGFARENFNTAVFSRYDINTIIIADEKGKVLYSQGYDYATGQPEPVPASVLAAIATPGSPLMDLSSQGYAGFIAVPEKGGPGFFASSPILHSDHARPPKGMLIVGKYIYADEVEKFRPDSIHTLAITTIRPPGESEPAGRNRATETGPAVKITRINETFVEGTTRLRDHNNLETVQVTVGISRTMTMEGKNALLGFLLIELAMGLVLGLFIIIFLDKIVLSRLQLINHDISTIIASGNISGRVKIRNNDEISQLAHAMNLMLAHVAAAQDGVIESERKLHHAEEVAKFGHWELDMSTKTVTASAGARQIYGLGGKELTLPDIQKVPLPQYRSGLDRRLQELIEEKKPYNTEFLIRRPTDNAIIAIHSLAEYDPGRNVVFGVIQDITDRRQAENALRESEERYRSLTDNLPEFVFVHRNGTILYANATVSNAMGISQEEFQGRSIFEFIAPESRAIIVESCRQRSNAEPVEPFEASFQMKDGQKKVGFVNAALIQYRGEPAFLAIVTDITGRKTMEQALSTANRKLHMLSSITRHDIRNKILGLRSYIAIALMSAHNEAEARLFGQLEDSARTIDEQLEFTREYQTMGMNAPQWIPVPGVIERVKTQVNLGDIRIRDESANLEIFADPLFEKVFYNLFDNAIRYGERITTLHIRYQKPDSENLILIVEDDGVGIPVEDKSDIFERGFGRNTGLGLFMIREILGITGITIRETGIPGKGAQFEMLVPKGIYRLTGPAPDEQQ